MTASPSATTFVVGDRLPWPDETAASPDTGPLDPGVICDGGSRRECTIRKISARGVTLVGAPEKAPGEEIAIELETGQRAGTVAWVERGEIGICFDEPIDMVALLNRKLVSQPVERRTMPRVEIRSGVYLKFAENLRAATMRNISARGLQIEGDDLPDVGTYVSVFVEGLNIPPGEVVWKRGRVAGIEVFEELSWTSIVPWVKTTIRKAAD
ncbi:MAG TPA: PilZ domain-containing protein [Sphingomicrobium sp.]|nr:PilZ domain-containing protein [Sphingomicrobium sp.]